MFLTIFSFCEFLGTGKPKRFRTNFTDDQLIELEEYFQRSQYISREKQFNLAKKLDIKERQVKIWFQNRRMKEKREKFEQNHGNIPEARPLSPSSHSLHSLSSDVSSPSSNYSRSPVNVMSVQEIRDSLMQYQTYYTTYPEVATEEIFAPTSTEVTEDETIAEYPVREVMTGSDVFPDQEKELMQLYDYDQQQTVYQTTVLTPAEYEQNYAHASEVLTGSATNQFEYASTVAVDNICDQVELPIDVSTYWSLFPYDELYSHTMNHHETST